MEKKLLVKGGMLLDPANGYNQTSADILMINDRIERIEEEIVPEEGMTVLRLNGELVSPGFIDVHAHVYTGVSLGVDGDMVGIRTGTTTVIDAGSAGPENIRDFIEKDIKRCRTRIYAMLHYAKTGLLNPPEADAEKKYDLDLVAKAWELYQEYIVGIKARASKSCTGALGITSIKAGKEAADRTGLPLIVHIGNMPPQVEDVLAILTAGDIVTHAFHGKTNNLFADGVFKEEAKAARERGVLLDIGHGKESYNFNIGKAAKEQGIDPDLIGTDIHALNYQGPVYSLSVTLDKMLAIGYDLAFCIRKVTADAAAAFGLTELGKLVPGSKGDLTIFTVKHGLYEFEDSNGNRITGSKSIQPEYTVVDGEIVWKREGR